MDLHSIATAFARGHDTMFLLKLRNVTDDLAEGGNGEIFTVVSLRRGGLCLELLDAVLAPVYGEDAEVVFMYPLTSVEALAKHVIGDKAVELMQESADDIVDAKGTGNRDCPKGEG